MKQTGISELNEVLSVSEDVKINDIINYILQEKESEL